LLLYARTLTGDEPVPGDAPMREARPPSISEVLGALDQEAPRIRADCIDGPRPCPWVRCRWHALWVIKPREALLLAHHTDEQIIRMLSEMKYSCVLDVCDLGEATLELTGEVLHTTRERVRQIEECEKTTSSGIRYTAGALAKLRRPQIMRMIRPYRDHSG